MLIFVAAEATLFGCLLGSWFYLRLLSRQPKSVASAATKISIPHQPFGRARGVSPGFRRPS